MTITEDRDTTAPEVAPADTSEVLFGQGQAAWLAIVTVMAGLALAVSFVALFEANSGGGSGGAADPGGPAGPAGPTTELTIELADFAFDPERVEVVADAGLTVDLANAGAVEHNWTVLGERIEAEADFDESLVLFASDDLAAGASGSGSFELAEGSYQVICTITGHFDLGMAGTVVAQ